MLFITAFFNYYCSHYISWPKRIEHAIQILETVCLLAFFRSFLFQYFQRNASKFPKGLSIWGAHNRRRIVIKTKVAQAEWEKAARAGTKTAYPWIDDKNKGKTVSCENAFLDDGKTTGSVKGEHDGCSEDRTWPRGQRQAHAYGLYDMHGNAGEWIENWYAPQSIVKYYAKAKLALPMQGVRKLVRGGSWDENRENLRSSFRNVKQPDSGDGVYGSIGFRCVYDK